MGDAGPTGPAGASIAYVLKGYPRMSELFIASEILRLETIGVPVRLFVIKPGGETADMPITARITARPEYLPATTSLSRAGLHRWLRRHLGQFAPSVRRVARQRPGGLLRAARAAAAQALRARAGFWALPKSVYVKEWLQAAVVADRVLASPEIRHMHAHFCHGATTVAWLAALMTGMPFSFTAHAKDLYCEPLNPAGLLARKLRAARFAVTCTEANRQHMLAAAGDTPVHRIYHGLNAELASRVHETADLVSGSRHAIRMLGVGRLVHKKGFDVFIAACGLLAARGVPFTAVLVGEDGEHGPALRDAVTRAGLEDHVVFAGPMTQAQLFQEYQRASVFCLPCRVVDNGDRDGIPNVLMEAMVCGVPVVTTAISGIPELVRDGDNGLFVPVGDAASLADAVLRIHQDPALATRLSQAGRQTIERDFDGDRLAGHLASLFHEVTA